MGVEKSDVQESLDLTSWYSFELVLYVSAIFERWSLD
jgi:hypothetical protein